MKTIVLSAILTVATSMNVCANQFAYNHETNAQNQVTTETVYKKNGNYLEHHLKYDFAYDEQGRVIRKEAFRWNDIEEAYSEGVTGIFSTNRVAVPYKEARTRAESDMRLTMDNILRFMCSMGM